MDNLRQEKLQQLKDFLESGNENMTLATTLEAYFLGQRTGCACKFNTVKSALNNYWEQHKTELL